MSRIKDLMGQRFGRLVVQHLSDERIHGRVAWVCLCDCGTVKLVDGGNLKTGKIKSCGCIKKDSAKDISGQRFGKLTAIRPSDRRASNGYIMWECQCACGEVTRVSLNNLRCGTTKSCGCMRKTWRQDLENMQLTEDIIIKI